MNLNLNGGPSKNAAQLSSLPVARRYGRLCLMSTLLMTLLCPVISPTEEPLSHRKTAPNLPGREESQGGHISPEVPETGSCGAGAQRAAARDGGTLTAVLLTRPPREQTTGGTQDSSKGSEDKQEWPQVPLGRNWRSVPWRPGLTSPPREGALRAAAGGSSKALLILQQSYRGGGTRKHTSC